jgi:hypothetical protein
MANINHNGDGESHLPTAESRQPQLNTKVCGCRCGRASASRGDGGGGEGNGADGAHVYALPQDNSNSQSVQSNYFRGENGIEYGPTADPVFTRFASFVLTEEGFLYDGSNVVLEDPFRDRSELDSHDRAQTPDSIANPISSSQPSLTSSSMPTGCIGSPGPDLNGLGDWATPNYFFTAAPLPLAPQFIIPLGAQLPIVGNEDDRMHGYPTSLDSGELEDDLQSS